MGSKLEKKPKPNRLIKSKLNPLISMPVVIYRLPPSGDMQFWFIRGSDGEGPERPAPKPVLNLFEIDGHTVRRPTIAPVNPAHISKINIAPAQTSKIRLKPARLE